MIVLVTQIENNYYLCDDMSHGVFFSTFKVAMTQIQLEEVVVDYYEMDY